MSNARELRTFASIFIRLRMIALADNGFRICLFLSFSFFRRLNTTRLRAGAIIHSVGQRDALKMNKSRAASISDVDGNKPEVRCGFLGLPRRNCSAYAR